MNNTQALETISYLQIRKESQDKIELKSLIDEWALNIFIENKQYQDAISILEQLIQKIQKIPTNPQWNYLYANCLHQLGTDPTKALRFYDSALENGYNEFWVKFNRGILSGVIGEREAASDDLRRALTLAPEHQATGDVQKAIRDYCK